jgi:hypothetical protein
MNHLPMRGDGVESWLKEKRDEAKRTKTPGWALLDDLLIRYQELADTGAILEGQR